MCVQALSQRLCRVRVLCSPSCPPPCLSPSAALYKVLCIGVTLSFWFFMEILLNWHHSMRRWLMGNEFPFVGHAKVSIKKKEKLHGKW